MSEERCDFDAIVEFAFRKDGNLVQDLVFRMIRPTKAQWAVIERGIENGGYDAFCCIFLFSLFKHRKDRSPGRKEMRRAVKKLRFCKNEWLEDESDLEEWKDLRRVVFNIDAAMVQ